MVPPSQQKWFCLQRLVFFAVRKGDNRRLWRKGKQFAAEAGHSVGQHQWM